MKSLRKVKRQIVQVERDLKVAVKEVNAQAARKLAQGRYEASQEMVALAKAIQEFSKDVKGLKDRWASLGKQKSEKAETTPVWEYYQPIARAIATLGDEAGFERIVEWISRNAATGLKPGDVLIDPKGQPMWQRAISKAKRPMIKEGFLEKAKGQWKLTKSGRNLASQST